MIHKHNDRFLTYAAKLDALSPLKVLTRGYALVQTGEGEVLQSIKQVHTGDSISIKITDGSLSASVTKVKEEDYGTE
jgi:exodeoxyribonuclease VII large subunit